MLQAGDKFKFQQKSGRYGTAQVLEVLPWSKRPLKCEFIDWQGKHIEQFNEEELGEINKLHDGARMPSVLH